MALPWPSPLPSSASRGPSVLRTEGLANDTRGLYDLRDVQVKKVGNYWLKTTGVSSMQAAGVPEEMHAGAGRWRLLAQRPGSMALYYCTTSYVQTTLKQKLWRCPTPVLVGFSMIISIFLRAWCLSLLLLWRCCCLWVGFFFWECGVLVRFASAQPRQVRQQWHATS
jgi:hypothetical protein